MGMNDFKRSLWVFHVNTGSCNGCDIEIVASLTPRYDIERFGMKLVGTPRHADVLLVTGPVARGMDKKLRRVFEQTPDPKVVMAIGNCGISGDVFYESYNLVGPIDKVVPVDVFVHGCPPRPEAIIDGVVKAWAKLEEKGAEGKKGLRKPVAGKAAEKSGGTKSAKEVHGKSKAGGKAE